MPYNPNLDPWLGPSYIEDMKKFRGEDSPEKDAPVGIVGPLKTWSFNPGGVGPQIISGIDVASGPDRTVVQVIERTGRIETDRLGLLVKPNKNGDAYPEEAGAIITIGALRGYYLKGKSETSFNLTPGFVDVDALRELSRSSAPADVIYEEAPPEREPRSRTTYSMGAQVDPPPAFFVWERQGRVNYNLLTRQELMGEPVQREGFFKREDLERALAARVVDRNEYELAMQASEPKNVTRELQDRILKFTNGYLGSPGDGAEEILGAFSGLMDKTLRKPSGPLRDLKVEVEVDPDDNTRFDVILHGALPRVFPNLYLQGGEDTSHPDDSLVLDGPARAARFVGPTHDDAYRWGLYQGSAPAQPLWWPLTDVALRPRKTSNPRRVSRGTESYREGPKWRCQPYEARFCAREVLGDRLCVHCQEPVRMSQDADRPGGQRVLCADCAPLRTTDRAAYEARAKRRRNGAYVWQDGNHLRLP